MSLVSSCSCLLCNILRPGVKSKIKMYLVQRRQPMFKLHLSDQPCYCQLKCVLYCMFYGISNISTRTAFPNFHTSLVSNSGYHRLSPWHWISPTMIPPKLSHALFSCSIPIILMLFGYTALSYIYIYMYISWYRKTSLNGRLWPFK